VDDDRLLCWFPGADKGDPTRGPTNASTKPLLEYVPQSQNGFTIITSRTREVALKMVDHKDIIEIQPMERSEALGLLQRKLEQPGESQESQNLVNAFEFMQLAIVQAASYIRTRAPSYSVSQYLKDFQRSDREATKLLKKEAGHLSRDWEVKNPILVTWQISFDYLRHTKPSAAEYKHGVGIAFFYFSFNDEAKQDDNGMLRELLSPLSLQLRDGEKDLEQLHALQSRVLLQWRCYSTFFNASLADPAIATFYSMLWMRAPENATGKVF
jgi:hypothetical protein